MKIVIFNEANYRTGGVESIYQFIHAVNEVGGDGYICFKNRTSLDPVPNEYKKYNIKIMDAVEDIAENLIVVPEVWTDDLNNIKNARKAIWWLSVYNNHGKFQQFNDSSIFHFYQSEYAKDFLIKNGAANIIPLHDYIDGVCILNTEKKNIITYNPAKGKEATEFVINHCPGINFVPLVNMTKAQILHALSESKIYIDFGHHPGRDRIPREAALCNNIVITSCLGSAKFYEDVPILDAFKLRELNSSISVFLAEKLADYDNQISYFEFYKEQINNQKTILFNESKYIIDYFKL